jgi:hypothetical protein
MCIPPRSGQFLPSQFTQHLTANAYCVSATKRRLDDSAQHRPEIARCPRCPPADAAAAEDSLPEDDLTSDTNCKGDVVEMDNQERYSSKVCVNSEFTYTRAPASARRSA